MAASKFRFLFFQFVAEISMGSCQESSAGRISSMARRSSGLGIGLRLVLLLIGAALVAGRAEALEWRWSYEGVGVSASGSFTTKDTPDADGFYEITALAGQANGVAIAGLQPPGTAIPATRAIRSTTLSAPPSRNCRSTASDMDSRAAPTTILSMARISSARLLRFLLRPREPQDERTGCCLQGGHRPLTA